jgi:phospholipid/cholesterol/gamma-HCH transport system substrate-binding protein
MAVSVGAMFALCGLPAVPYDPTTGRYVRPDGRIYTQSDLAGMTPEAKTWQQLVVPPLAAH